MTRSEELTEEARRRETAKSELIEVGSKAYYEGFFSTPLQENRGDGTEQALKLGLGTTTVVVALFAGFMVSNGLL